MISVEELNQLRATGDQQYADIVRELCSLIPMDGRDSEVLYSKLCGLISDYGGTRLNEGMEYGRAYPSE